ncbi:MAG: helix-turn-helix domain-containing protein [Planctomycetota bacterium]|jgi:DNA-binding LacI/PurR family transcriptional regulator
MHTEFRLKKILDDAGQDKHGRIQMIAKGANVNRHTVRKIYNNEATTVSLETVGRICEWLEEKGLCEGLPGALFAARPSKLFGAMVEPGLITFYLGEYRSTGFPKFRVARDDAAAAAMLVHSLSRRSHNRKLLFSHVHVPSHIPAEASKRTRLPQRLCFVACARIAQAGRPFSWAALAPTTWLRVL